LTNAPDNAKKPWAWAILFTHPKHLTNVDLFVKTNVVDYEKAARLYEKNGDTLVSREQDFDLLRLWVQKFTVSAHFFVENAVTWR